MTAAADPGTELDEAVDRLLSGYDPGRTDPVDLFGRQFDLGLAWVHFDRGSGGLGLPATAQATVEARLVAAGAPLAFHRNPLGVGMVGPTIHAHGDEAQRRRYLRPLFTGEEVWCQLFSEPGAGSDLASVATRAQADGDGWTVTGQKVWTSYGHVARRGLLLARTDPDRPKHAGLTSFVVDMAAPGVEVRPLPQMTGDAEFNEVYLTDVAVPDRDRLGPVGGGWPVIITTLMNERVAIGDQVGERGAGIIGAAVALWRDRPAARTAVRRDRLAQLWVRAEVLRLVNLRSQHRRGAGAPGPEGSLAKVLSAALNQDVTAFEMEVLGAAGMVKEGGYPRGRSERDPFALGDVVHDFLRSQANSIEGGTSDVSRTVLGERVLGLPPEPRGDKGVPWNRIPR